MQTQHIADNPAKLQDSRDGSWGHNHLPNRRPASILVCRGAGRDRAVSHLAGAPTAKWQCDDMGRIANQQAQQVLRRY
jgi:hypothetical protein